MKNAIFLSLSIGVLLGLSGAAGAQTSCGSEHTGPGVFICYPNPSENPADNSVPELFHVSAQANAPEGAATRHYSVFLDNELIYDNRLASPLERLSIEVNVRSPFRPGAHTLRIAVSGIGTAEVKGIQFHPSATAGFCEPLSRVESLSACFASIKAPLHWSLSPSAGYASYFELYSRNLKSLEADVADAAAVDSRGNLYVALHLFAGLELRKYTPARSIIYDSVIQACGEGFLAISGLAVDNAGHVWMAGNASACFSATAGAWKSHVSDPSQPHGFVLLLDTSKPTSTAPVYLTYLADQPYEISAIRVDTEGNTYITGTTSSTEFPHNSSMGVSGDQALSKGAHMSFVSVLDRSGSALRWSTLLRNADFAALALDPANNVYLAGRTGGGPDAVLARLSASGTKLSYVTRLGHGDARAVSVAAGDVWAVVDGESQSFALALDPCTKGTIYSTPLPRDEDSVGAGISKQLALDAFATAFKPVNSACSSKAQ